MKIKKFTAKTFSEALELVKKELSPDAIILSTEEKKGFRPYVEVTAAEDYEDGPMQNAALRTRQEMRKADAPKPASALAKRTHQNSDTASRMPHAAAAYAAPAARSTGQASSSGDDDLRAEINGLRSMLESLKKTGYEMSLPADKRAVMQFLLDRSIREQFALRICDRTTDLNEVPRLISSDIRIRPQNAPAAAVMFIGPTGVGKTTTIAKLAARAVQSGKKAAIINLDTYRIGAVEQVRIYSRILGIPLATAGSVQEMQASLKKFTETRDIVFIDTAGRNPRDAAALEEISAIRRGPIPVEVHLLMSANADDACMMEACDAYAKVPVDCIGFSKLDEAVRFGSLYNLCITYGKPVSWLTTGQRVPGDIEPATQAGLADLIVGKEHPAC